jgi:hypothetical protein
VGAVRHFLSNCGQVVARLWLALLCLCIMLAFPISGLAVSFYIGTLAADLVASNARLAALLIIALVVGIFLAVYVWEPHVKPVVSRISDGLLKDIKA